MSEKGRILCVDDEENILKAIKRSLRKKYDIETATSAKEGLEILRTKGPFEVVVSDMKMPEMNGATFLRHVRQEYPKTVRILLTGFADMDTVVSAVNEGHIYRFLAKPCSAGVLMTAIDDAIEQHRLLTAEKVLLEKTLKGSIQAMSEILALANPAAFGRANRISQLALKLARDLEVPDLWQVEVSALLSQIGCITLPETTAMKWYAGEKLDEVEEGMIERLPEMTYKILGPIPRLEKVLAILRFHTKNFDGTGQPKIKLAGEDIPIGARLLKVAVRCETLVNRGKTPTNILDDLRANKLWYDPDIVAAYETLAADSGVEETVRGVTMMELRTGMIFTEEVKSKAGLLLVAAGQECTVSLLERIQNYERTVGLELPMWVANSPASEAETPGEDPASLVPEKPDFKAMSDAELVDLLS